MNAFGGVLQIKKRDLNFNTVCCACSAFLLSLYIFFPLIPYRSTYGIMSAFILLIGDISKTKAMIVLQKKDMIFLAALFYTGASLVIAGNSYTGTEIFQVFIFAFLIFHLIDISGENFHFFLLFFSVFSLAFMIATYLQYYGSNIIVSFIRQYFISNQESMEYYYTLESWSSYCGLANTSAENSFFISFAASVTCAKFLGKRISWVNVVLYVLCVGAIMLTSKRGIMLANLVMFIACGFLSKKFQVKKNTILRFIISVVLLISIMAIINMQTSALTKLIERFKTTSLLNGRDNIYLGLLQRLGTGFLFGKGFANTYLYYSQGAHNIYIQLLYDLGIVGLVLYVWYFAVNLKSAVQSYRISSNEENKEQLLMCFYFQGLFLVYGLSGNPLFTGNMLYIYFVILAATQNLRRKVKNENSHTHIQQSI